MPPERNAQGVAGSSLALPLPLPGRVVFRDEGERVAVALEILSNLVAGDDFLAAAQVFHYLEIAPYHVPGHLECPDLVVLDLDIAPQYGGPDDQHDPVARIAGLFHLNAAADRGIGDAGEPAFLNLDVAVNPGTPHFDREGLVSVDIALHRPADQLERRPFQHLHVPPDPDAGQDAAFTSLHLDVSDHAAANHPLAAEGGKETELSLLAGIAGSRDILAGRQRQHRADSHRSTWQSIGHGVVLPRGASRPSAGWRVRWGDVGGRNEDTPGEACTGIVLQLRHPGSCKQKPRHRMRRRGCSLHRAEWIRGRSGRVLGPDPEPDPEDQVVLPLVLRGDAAGGQLALIERAHHVAYLGRHLDGPGPDPAKAQTDVDGRPHLVAGLGKIERVPLEPAAEPEGRLDMRAPASRWARAAPRRTGRHHDVV